MGSGREKRRWGCILVMSPQGVVLGSCGQRLLSPAQVSAPWRAAPRPGWAFLGSSALRAWLQTVATLLLASLQTLSQPGICETQALPLCFVTNFLLSQTHLFLDTAVTRQVWPRLGS